ncbi:MAG: hypothetical protein AABW46_01165 [Nanoarchaeota archaeon]
MYIRSKKRKLKSSSIIEYAYLVSIKWRKKRTPKQEVKKYLGRIYKLEKRENKTFQNQTKDLEEYFKKTSIKTVKKDLFKSELQNHGFSQQSEDILINNKLKVNLNKATVENSKNNKPISLELNNNFLNSYTLNRIINYTPPKNLTKLQLGKEYANRLISAGIPLQEEVFVRLFKKEFS